LVSSKEPYITPTERDRWRDNSCVVVENCKYRHIRKNRPSRTRAYARDDGSNRYSKFGKVVWRYANRRFCANDGLFFGETEYDLVIRNNGQGLRLRRETQGAVVFTPDTHFGQKTGTIRRIRHSECKAKDGLLCLDALTGRVRGRGEEQIDQEEISRRPIHPWGPRSTEESSSLG